MTYPLVGGINYLLSKKNNIETFKRIEGIGVQLKRPQIFTPVYLYQRWLIENPQERKSKINN